MIHFGIFQNIEHIYSKFQTQHNLILKLHFQCIIITFYENVKNISIFNLDWLYKASNYMPTNAVLVILSLEHCLVCFRKNNTKQAPYIINTRNTAMIRFLSGTEKCGVGSVGDTPVHPCWHPRSHKEKQLLKFVIPKSLIYFVWQIVIFLLWKESLSFERHWVAQRKVLEFYNFVFG